MKITWNDAKRRILQAKDLSDSGRAHDAKTVLAYLKTDLIDTGIWNTTLGNSYTELLSHIDAEMRRLT